jgi:hypothetical protein
MVAGCLKYGHGRTRDLRFEVAAERIDEYGNFSFASR